ncbi:MAG: hypothetical protein P9X22_02070 [Candidatus Zapsychrus exili]|nr:hypothetical protein [Candidatus Zapsychrus exili]
MAKVIRELLKDESYILSFDYSKMSFSNSKDLSGHELVYKFRDSYIYYYESTSDDAKVFHDIDITIKTKNDIPVKVETVELKRLKTSKNNIFNKLASCKSLAMENLKINDIFAVNKDILLVEGKGDYSGGPYEALFIPHIHYIIKQILRPFSATLPLA